MPRNILASLAATGILLVFTITTVLLNKGVPSTFFKLENSPNTVATSLPLSPTRIKTTMSTTEFFAKDCKNIVLPVPKPPEITAVPPNVIGNRVSTTRWPVTNEVFVLIFFR